jgi:hypothetical protein
LKMGDPARLYARLRIIFVHQNTSLQAIMSAYYSVHGDSMLADVDLGSNDNNGHAINEAMHQQLQGTAPPSAAFPGLGSKADVIFSRPPSIDTSTYVNPNSSQCAYYSISVGLPSRVSKGTSYIPGVNESHMEYAIISIGHGGEAKEVQRRFKDIVALSDRFLALLVPLGIIVPPRPRRDALEGSLKMSQVFIERRKAAIIRWLSQVNQHPLFASGAGLYETISQDPAVLAAKCAFRVFLEEPGDMRGLEAWISTASSHPLQPSPRTTSSLASSFSLSSLLGVLSSGANVIKQAVTSQATPLTPNSLSNLLERQLKEEALRLTELSSLLAGLRSKKDALLSATSAKAQALSHLSVAFKTLGGYERALNRGLGRYQQISPQPSSSTRTELVLSELLSSASSLTELSHDHLSVPFALIDYHLRLCTSSLATMRYREGLLVHLGSLESDLGKARTALSIAESTPSQFGMRDFLSSKVTALEGATFATRQRYGQVSEMNALELSRVRAFMAVEFQSMMVEIAVVQLASAQKGAHVWAAQAMEEQGSKTLI